MRYISTKSVPLPHLLSERQQEMPDSWDVSLQAFATFVKEHGHGNVKPFVEGQQHLYQWIKVQRHRYYLRDGGKITDYSEYLTLERIEALNKLGMDWTRLETPWEDNFEGLKEYINKHGHMKVTKTDDPELLSWILNQRLAFESKERREKLNSIGFEWGTKNNDTWMKKYEELADFFNLYKHTFIPLKDESYFELGTWVHEQHTQYAKLMEKKHTSMRKEQIKLLDKLGFVWSLQDYMWTMKCMELNDYVKTYRAWPSSRTKNQALVAWLSRQLGFQRKKRKGLPNNLTDEREQQLEAALDRSAPSSISENMDNADKV